MLSRLSFLQLMAIAGVLLLTMALSSAHLRRLPISTAAVYLALGLALSPLGLDWLALDLPSSSRWLERAAEVALIISLFVGGLRLRQPLRSPAWSAVWPLAGPLMLCSIAGLALLAHVALGLAGPQALLLAAVLAPTDPVLASPVSISQAADADRVRYGLSGEAGLNDGLAFPFVSVALAWSNGLRAPTELLQVALTALLWAVPVGLSLGFALGMGVGRLAVHLRSRQRDIDAPNDLLALALIALSYVAAQALGALGFLAAFAAGVGLRHAEMKVVRDSPHPRARAGLAGRLLRGAVHPPAEDLVEARVSEESVREPAVAAGVLVAESMSFGATAERLLEVALVVLVGVSLGSSWDARGLLLAPVLFALIRPLFSQLLLARTRTSTTQRWLLGWFGVRGIGSLYYLSYALNHGVAGAAAAELSGLTVSVVAISIVLHGVTAQPLLGYYERVRQRRRGA